MKLPEHFHPASPVGIRRSMEHSGTSVWKPERHMMRVATMRQVTFHGELSSPAGHSADSCSIDGTGPVCSSPEAGGGKPAFDVNFAIASNIVIGFGTNRNFCSDS